MTRQHLSALALAVSLGCSASKSLGHDTEAPDPDVVRPPPGQARLESIPGPMLGPFDSYAAALAAACERILTKPRARAGRKPPPTALREEKGAFELRWQVSTEYCGWLYYTPGNKYELSLLTDQTRTDPTGRSKNCLSPSRVEDDRYPADSIKYIFVIHSHPFDTPISEDDIRFIEYQGSLHGFDPRTKDGDLRLSIAAFFSNGDGVPACDGFYIYSAQTRRILKWSRDQGRWMCEQTHSVEWHDYDSLDLEIKEAKAPCPGRGAP